jgi:SSS family solute:Na+ symporter
MAELVSPQLATATVIVYLVALLLIAVYSYYRGEFLNLEDFFIVSRQLGVVVMVFTVMATILSTFFYLGIAGTFVGNGIGWMVVASWQIITALALLYAGTRIWKLGKEFNYITPAELYADFYDTKMMYIILPIIYTLAMTPFFILQMRGGGLALDGITGGAISFEIGVTAFLIIAVVYLLIGGMRAVALTDLFQGVLFAGLLGVFALFMAVQFVPTQIGESVFIAEAAENPDNLTWPGGAGAFGVAATFSLLIGSGLGNLGQGPVFQRMFMADSVRTIKLTALIYAVLSVGMITIIFYLTTGSVQLVGIPENTDQIFPIVLGENVPILGAIFVAGALAAGMSTIDSNMMSLSSFYTVDIINSFIDPEQARFDEQTLTWIGRGIIIVIAIIAYFLALRTPASLTELALLVLQYSAATLPPLLGIITGWKQSSSAGATWSLIVGVVAATVATFVWADPLNIDATFWALSTGIVTFIVVSYFTSSIPEERLNKFTDVMHDPEM